MGLDLYDLADDDLLPIPNEPLDGLPLPCPRSVQADSGSPWRSYPDILDRAHFHAGEREALGQLLRGHLDLNEFREPTNGHSHGLPLSFTLFERALPVADGALSGALAIRAALGGRTRVLDHHAPSLAGAAFPGASANVTLVRLRFLLRHQMLLSVTVISFQQSAFSFFHES
jgi:hypothetical protein